jgi:hypothetical protein
MLAAQGALPSRLDPMVLTQLGLSTEIQFAAICLFHLSAEIMLPSISGPTNCTFYHIISEWLIRLLLNMGWNFFPFWLFQIYTS